MKKEAEINAEITILKNEILRADVLIESADDLLEVDMRKRTRDFLQDRVNSLSWVLKTDEVK
jgi:hypothetical protein